MEVILYREEYKNVDTIDRFLRFYNTTNMTYLASDLLKKGLSPPQITDAILKAIKVGKSSGLKIEKHFLPIFTQVNSKIISDCKLSQLGYGLLLINADVELGVVGKWQVNLLERFLE
ncbi:hypothetical protein ADIWIN_1137 [Winogradskyella psychrotolerans RS-3]|uniref:Uncharacterized protein n=1 Tax=Winogradskyella psychrotolerans RS-3 TaxID=641526 RepID=S7VWM5_9FLAO|nr:hypothetical protein [Winogradskyella psychrotolerans]EPR73777.1 hypothetical protein ADIWIN_1137 [Winogradskyella psychrotolerans RS-3]